MSAEKQPKIGQRRINLNMAKGIVDRAPEPIETGDIAKAMNMPIQAVTQLLVDLQRDNEISQVGNAHFGESRVRWTKYRPPRPIQTPNFTQYRAPKPTIIPVRAGGTIAKDIYQHSISLGGTEK